MYALDKALILDDGFDALVRVSVDCPTEFANDFAERMHRSVASRVEVHFYDGNKNLLGFRYHHRFFTGYHEPILLGESTFRFTPAGITCEVAETHVDYKLFLKSEFATFVIKEYEATPSTVEKHDRRLSRIEHLIECLWFSPGMPGMVQAQGSFEHMAAAE